MEQSASWEANSSSASQEIFRISWTPQFHYRIHKLLSPVPVLGQSNPVHDAPSILILSSNHSSCIYQYKSRIDYIYVG